MRLNKFISDSGYCSRREADKYIERGVVFLNGRKASVGDQVEMGDEVKVNGLLIEGRTTDVLLAFNKPTGVTSTTDTTDPTNIVDFVNYSERVFPIGRLDKESQGLILLTNNGDMVNKILRAGNRHEKEYVVTVDKPITDEFVQGMSSGVPILGQMTKRCKVTKEAAFVFRIVLVQGLNRQIRRMCEYFGYNVTKLERVRIMHLELKGIPLGEWREVEGEPLLKLMKLIANSSGETKAQIRAKEEKAQKPKAPERKKNEPKHPFERVQPKGVPRPFRKSKGGNSGGGNTRRSGR
jgi:23S rRNA pseudouridine2604 synthase